MAESLKNVSPQVIRLVCRVLALFLDTGLLTSSEYNLVRSHLASLAKNGTSPPEVTPKLITAPEVAELFGISYGEFRKLAAAGYFPFRRRTLGKSVRFYYPDIVNYMRTGGLDDDKAKEGNANV